MEMAAANPSRHKNRLQEPHDLLPSREAGCSGVALMQAPTTLPLTLTLQVLLPELRCNCWAEVAAAAAAAAAAASAAAAAVAAAA
jgi:hypothetical protein